MCFKWRKTSISTFFLFTIIYIMCQEMLNQIILNYVLVHLIVKVRRTTGTSENNKSGARLKIDLNKPIQEKKKSVYVLLRDQFFLHLFLQGLSASQSTSLTSSQAGGLWADGCVSCGWSWTTCSALRLYSTSSSSATTASCQSPERWVERLAP